MIVKKFDIFQWFNFYLNVFAVKTLISQFFTLKVDRTNTIPKNIPNNVLCWLIYTTAWTLFDKKVTETARCMKIGAAV